MMEGWRACFIVLALDLALARDLPHTNQTYVVKHTDSCPDVGYYFKREPSPNSVDPGPCFLCFCQDNGTAICWQRENRRCEVERYHHHRVGRHSRYRRSPIGLSDIFFRDASRDFFDKKLPEECKPFEASFSDGCPPADWCIGCTVCDCDANGRWDCHILSFCDGKEKKKKIDPPRKPRRSSKNKAVMRQNQGKPKNTHNSITPTQAVVKKNVKEQPQNSLQKYYKNKANQTKPKLNLSKGNKIVQQSKNETIRNKNQFNKNQPNKIQRKGNNNQAKSTIYPINTIKNHPKLARNQNTLNKNQQKPSKLKGQSIQSKNPQAKPSRKYIKTDKKPQNGKKYQSRGKLNQTKLNTKPRKTTANYPNLNLRNKPPQKQNTKPPVRKPMRKKIQLQTKKAKQIQQKFNSSKVKIIKKDISSHKPMSLGKKKKIINNPTKDTIKLGQKVVKQVMASVEKMIMKEMNKINATRSQRSALHDCAGDGKEKKMGKIPGVSQRKYKKQQNNTLVDDFQYGRYKREISVREDEAVIENTTVVKIPNDFNLLQGNISGISTEIAKPKNTSFMYSSTDMPSTLTFTERQDNHNDYYKYFLHNNSSKSSIVSTTDFMITSTEYKKSDTFINFMIPVQPVHNISSYTMDNETVAAINPDFNDLKFKKWYIIKIRKETKNKPVERIVLPKPKPNYIFESAQTFLERPAPKKYIETTTEKHSLQLHKKLTKNNITDTTTAYAHNALINILRALNKSHTGEEKPKSKLNVMTYVRKFFHKMFSKKKSEIHKVYGLGAKEDHTLQILCENLGPCRINRNNKLILKYKLRQLNRETGNILRSIRIIKGLLHLLELPDISKTKIISNNTFHSDIQKLSAVLRDKYTDDGMKPMLSKTQLTQINYIKRNTQSFVECIKRFADLLNETLSLVKAKEDSRNLIKKKQRNMLPYEKVKKIITKYNVLQNTFLKKIYDLIHGDEKKITTSTTQIPLISVNKFDDYGTDKIIEKYSKNIIENLRKLKKLAEALSSKRRKRSILANDAGDDTADYLLNLMQYLITQNQPVENNQVYDGIDFLIDAIKNAPDIKPITKEVLNSTKNEILISSSDTDFSEHLTEEILDAKKVLKEDNQKIEDIGDDITVPMAENNDDDTIINTNYRVFNDVSSVKNSKHNDYSTPEYTSVSDKGSNDETEKTGFEKFEKYVNESKKYEMYTGDVDEEAEGVDNAIPVILNKTDPIIQSIEEQNSFNNQSVRDANILEENSSESNVPEADSKKENVLEANTQELNIPEENIAESNAPDTNAPEANMRDANMIEVNMPEISMPEVNVPEVNMPIAVIPESNTPEANIPEESMAGANLPEISMPQENKKKTKTKSRKTKDRTKNILNLYNPEDNFTVKSKESSSETLDSGSEAIKTKLDWLEETFDKEIREFVQLNVSESSKPRASNQPVPVKTESQQLEKMDVQIKENVSGVSKEYKEETKKNEVEKTTPGDNVMYKKQMEFLNSLDYGTERAEFEDPDSKDYVNIKADEPFPSYFV